MTRALFVLLLACSTAGTPAGEIDAAPPENARVPADAGGELRLEARPELAPDLPAADPTPEPPRDAGPPEMAPDVPAGLPPGSKDSGPCFIDAGECAVSGAGGAGCVCVGDRIYCGPCIQCGSTGGGCDGGPG